MISYFIIKSPTESSKYSTSITLKMIVNKHLSLSKLITKAIPFV